MNLPGVENSSYQSILSSGLKTMRNAGKEIERAQSEPISSSRMVNLIESERMFEAGAQVVRNADQVVGMLLNVRK